MKKWQIIVLAVVASIGISAGELGAQTSKGMTEVGFLAGYFQSTESGSDGTLLANLRIGKFFTDGFEAGFGVSAAGSTDDLSATSTGEVFLVYHFSPASTMSWYTRLGYFASFDDFGTGYADLGLGFKSFFRENVAFFWEAAYGQPIQSDGGDGIFKSLTGISLFIGGPKS